MDFLTPYNILRHANAAFYENVRSTKWNERKEAIGELVDLMDKNPRLANDDPSGLHQLVSELTKVLKADSNINVAAAAAAALARLARGLGGGFRPFAPSVLTTASMRLKEVKPVLRDPCVECLDACYASTTFDAVLPPIKEGLANKAPAAKVQTCEFFTRIMRKIDFETAKKAAPATKEVVEEMCKLALGSDANCREAAMKSLAAFLHAIGRQAGLPLIRTVADDKQKMSKVDAFFEEFAKEVPKEETTATTTETPTEAPKSEEAAGPQSEKKLTELGKLRAEIAGYEFLTPYDLLKHTKDDFYTELQSKKWQERKDAMGHLVAIMEKNPRLVANEVAYHQLIDECTKLLKADSNINVAGTAAQTLERLARGLGTAFRPAAPSTIAACLLRLKEVKAALRDPCVKCLDAAYLTTNLEAVLPAIKDGVLSKAPASKIQSCDFFTRIMVDVDYATAKQSAAGVKTVVDELCKLALGSDANCREAAMKSLAAFLRAVGKEAGSPLLSTVAEDKLKISKIHDYFEQFIADFPADHTAKSINTPPKSAPPKRPPSTAPRPAASAQSRPKTQPAKPQPIKPQVVKAENAALKERNGTTAAPRLSAPPTRPAAPLKPAVVQPKVVNGTKQPPTSAVRPSGSAGAIRPNIVARRPEGPPSAYRPQRLDSAPRIPTGRPLPPPASRTLSAARISVEPPRRPEQTARAKTPVRRPSSITRPMTAAARPTPLKPNVVRMPAMSNEQAAAPSTSAPTVVHPKAPATAPSAPTAGRSMLPAPRRSLLPTPSASRPSIPKQ